MSRVDAELHDRPVEHDADAVGELRHQREVVGDEQDREAEPRLEVEDLLQDLALHDDVERRGRLVHDHQLRIERQRDGEHDALAHAAGKLVRVVVEPRRRDADQREELSRRAPAPFRGSTPVCRASTSRNCSKIVITGFREFMALWKTIDAMRQRQAASCASIEGQDVLAVDHDVPLRDARRRAVQTHQREGDRALAAAGFARKARRSRPRRCRD